MSPLDLDGPPPVTPEERAEWRFAARPRSLNHTAEGVLCHRILRLLDALDAAEARLTTCAFCGGDVAEGAGGHASTLRDADTEPTQAGRGALLAVAVAMTQERKTKKLAGEPMPHSVTTLWAVLVDGQRIGTVYQRETTKTGFRRGYCVGQVPCRRWFGRLDGSTFEHPESKWGLSRGWLTKAEAVEELAKLAAPAGGSDVR